MSPPFQQGERVELYYTPSFAHDPPAGWYYVIVIRQDGRFVEMCDDTGSRRYIADTYYIRRPGELSPMEIERRDDEARWEASRVGFRRRQRARSLALAWLCVACFWLGWWLAR